MASIAYGALGMGGKAAVLVAALAASASAQEVTIAALGDSLTQGFGLARDDGFVPRLGAWLRARGHDVAVANAGVSGDTTAGGLARVGWTLTPDVDAMIVALGGNDLLRGLPPEVSRANLDGILRAAGAAGVEVLLVGLKAPGNFGPEWQAAFDSMYPELAEIHGALHVENFLAPLADPGTGRPGAAWATHMQPDGIHPRAEAQAIMLETVWPDLQPLL